MTAGATVAAVVVGAATLAMLATPGCSRETRSGPVGGLYSGERPAVNPAASGEVAASLDDRQAWVAGLSGRGDLGPGRLADLGRRGFFAASLCPAPGGAWTLDPGRPLLGYRVVWSCPECAEAGPGGSGQGEAVPGGSGQGEAVPGESDQSDGVPSDSGQGNAAPGGGRRALAVPPAGEHPWPAGDSPAEEIAREVTGLLERWGEEGYPLARVCANTRHDDRLLTVELVAYPGPRVSVAEAQFEGNRATRRRHLLRLLGWQGRESWRTRRWETARATLQATGLFDEVEGPLLVRGVGAGAAGGPAIPGDPGSAAAPAVGGIAAAPAVTEIAAPSAPALQGDSLLAGVLFRLRERRVNSFAGLIGYSGKSGDVSGFVTLELGNLFGTGRRTRVAWQAQRERESRFRFDWHEPFVWRLPLGADLELTHVMEDTLYAETNWGLGLVLAAGGSWDVTAGWRWGRLVVGGQDGEDRRRQTARFGVRHAEPLGTRAPSGWELEITVAQTQDAEETLRHGTGRVRGWTRARGLMLLVEEQAALVTGVESVLRGDALSVGGAESLRGYFEAAYRATRSWVQRLEVGPAPSVGGARFYGLLDLGWLREWQPRESGLVGLGVGDHFRWSAGCGMLAPSAAGDLRLDYAVPGGEPIWRGRIHLGLVNRF